MNGVSEVCPKCDRENTLIDWDVEDLGMTAYCPVCGARMMLCSICDNECDQDDSGKCKHSQE